MSERAKRTWSREAGSLAGLCLLALVGLGTAVAATARFTYVGELVANLRAYLGVGALLGAALCTLGRARWFALPAIAACVAHWAPILALYRAPTPVADGGVELTVASVNVNYTNADGRAFVRWLAETDAEVVAVLEVTPFFRELLDGFASKYPHRLIEQPDGDRFCLALLSRHPIRGGRVRWVHEAERAYVEAEVLVDGAPMHTVVLHPMRPGNGWGTGERNELLTHVARATAWRENSVVLGDFNATAFSPIFDDFLTFTGLRDSRQGFGWQPSWRSVHHLRGIWLAIDHVFVGTGVGVEERFIGPDVGSDHRPVIARLRIPEPDAPRRDSVVSAR